MKRALILTMILMASLSSGAVLLGVECPDDVYAHEIFSCEVYVSSTVEEGTVTLYPHSAKGVFESLVPMTEVKVNPIAVKVVEVKGWAKDAGADAFVVDGEMGDERVAALVPVRFVNPPIAVDVPTLNTEAGKREDFTVTITGRALNVRVWLESPTSTLEVSPPVDVGDVVEKDVAELYVTPSPHSFGSYTLTLYVEFTDEKGTHLLRYDVDLWVNPSLWVVGALLVAFVFLVVLVYLAYRKVRRKKEPVPTEAQ